MQNIATVSQILQVMDKPGLRYWANKVGLKGQTINQALRESAGLGTTLHYMAECYINGKDYGQLPIDERDKQKIRLEKCQSLEANLEYFKKWWDRYNFKDAETEVDLESPELRFRGRVDIIADSGDDTYVIDIKTGKAIYNDHRYQVAGYYLLAYEDGYDVSGACVIQIGRTPWERSSFWVGSGKELDPYIEVFKRARDLHYALEGVTTK